MLVSRTFFTTSISVIIYIWRTPYFSLEPLRFGPLLLQAAPLLEITSSCQYRLFGNRCRHNCKNVNFPNPCFVVLRSMLSSPNACLFRANRASTLSCTIINVIIFDDAACIFGQTNVEEQFFENIGFLYGLSVQFFCHASLICSKPPPVFFRY